MKLVMPTEACSAQQTINCKLLMQLSVLFALLSTLFACLNVTAAVAQEPMSFVDTQPPPAYEEEYYEWQIKVRGGTPPYQFDATGEMPPGLHFESRGAICGTPLRGISTSSHGFIIRVEDSSSRHTSIEEPFAITLMYKSTVAIAVTLLEGETNVYIDDLPKGRLQGGEKMSGVFLAGTSHSIRVDSEVQHPTKKDDTRFISVESSATVNGSSPDATFDYFCEYRINLVTEPQDALYELPDSSEWDRLSGWYREGSILEFSAANTIPVGLDTKYCFIEWVLPTDEHQKQDRLNWKISEPGKVSANYEKRYKLTINEPNALVKIDSTDVEGEGKGWYKAGETAKWSIQCHSPRSGTGSWGSLFDYRPVSKGYVEMNSPRAISIPWRLNLAPIVTGVVITLLVQGVIYLLWRLKRRYF